MNNIYRNTILFTSAFLVLLFSRQTLQAQRFLSFSIGGMLDIDRKFSSMPINKLSNTRPVRLIYKNNPGWYISLQYRTKRKILWDFSQVRHTQVISEFKNDYSIQYKSDYFLDRVETFLGAGYRVFNRERIFIDALIGLGFRKVNNNRKYVTYNYNTNQVYQGTKLDIYGYYSAWICTQVNYIPIKKTPLAITFNFNFTLPYKKHNFGAFDSKYRHYDSYLQNAIGCRLGLTYMLFKQKENEKR